MTTEPATTLRPRTVLAACAAALLAAVAPCGCGRPAGPVPARGVLLVTLSEGSAVPPGADSLGLAPLRFGPVSSDLAPSAASALTGLLPPEHGLRVDGAGALPESLPTLATILSARGHDCAAFLSDAALAPGRGLSRGFSTYSARPDVTNAATRFRATTRAVCAAATQWLASRPDPERPVFLWLHLSPRGGTAPTWASPAPPPGAPAAAPGLDGLAETIALFDPDSPVLVVPLFESTPEPGADGAPAGPRSFATPGTDGVPASSTGYVRSVRECAGGASVADVPWLLGLADALRPPYWESVVPWYAFRLPPVAVAGPGAPDPRTGLSGPVAPNPLATQSEMAAMRAAGHLGEGLVPPLPDDAPVPDSVSDEGLARIGRWRAALASTNRVAAARALVESDPDVPLFCELLGDALVASGETAEASNAYADASRIGYNMVRANRMLARCHAALGNVAAAIDRAEAAFLAGEDDAATRLELAQLLLRTGMAMAEAGALRSAGDCIDRVLLLEPSNPVARLESARLQLRAGDTNAAVGILRRAVRDAPGFAPASRLLEELDQAR